MKEFLADKWESLFWLVALSVIAFLPMSNLPSLCIAKMIGFNNCMGCGLGHSMQAAFHFHFRESFQIHPLGIFAIFILLHRIITLNIKPKTKLI